MYYSVIFAQGTTISSTLCDANFLPQLMLYEGASTNYLISKRQFAYLPNTTQPLNMIKIGLSNNFVESFGFTGGVPTFGAKDALLTYPTTMFSTVPMIAATCMKAGVRQY
jgi:hypothetical protein